MGLLYAEKLDLVISMSLSGGMAVCAGPGVQVGATWAEKSSPIGPEWPRSGKLEGSGQLRLAGGFGLAVKLWELPANRRTAAQN